MPRATEALAAELPPDSKRNTILFLACQDRHDVSPSGVSASGNEGDLQGHHPRLRKLAKTLLGGKLGEKSQLDSEPFSTACLETKYYRAEFDLHYASINTRTESGSSGNSSSDASGSNTSVNDIDALASRADCIIFVQEVGVERKITGHSKHSNITDLCDSACSRAFLSLRKTRAYRKFVDLEFPDLSQTVTAEAGEGADAGLSAALAGGLGGFGGDSSEKLLIHISLVRGASTKHTDSHTESGTTDSSEHRDLPTDPEELRLAALDAYLDDGILLSKVPSGVVDPGEMAHHF
jgi:hypothetical protein